MMVHSIYLLEFRKAGCGNLEVSCVELLNIAQLNSLLTFLYKQVCLCGKAAGQKSVDGRKTESVSSTEAVQIN